MVIVDTNVLMDSNNLEHLLEDFDKVTIPIEVLEELDGLKTAEGAKGCLARNAIKFIKCNYEDFDFITEETKPLEKVDDKIINRCLGFDDVTLVTNDISMEIKAKAKGLNTMNYYGKVRKGVLSLYEVTMGQEEYKEFSETGVNDKLDIVPVGQFVRIKNKNGAVLGDYRCLARDLWEELEDEISIYDYKYEVKARDIYQKCAIKSLEDDEFTVITGAAGTGKSLLAITECLKLMGKYGATTHIFVNPVKTRDTEDLGFYPGTRDEKLLSNFIGGILSTKLDGMPEVMEYMNNGSLRIYPLSDIRGIEIKAGDIMYITEAQNLSVDQIKLAIQRCAEGAKVIIEGDVDAQVDKYKFEGENNGLRRVIEVFTGTTVCDFGYINLPNVYRSPMVQLAEEL